MSALRALRRSDQEIAFRPWIYEIAKNACIDHLRRARRAQEVSIDSDDFSPHDEGRLSQSRSRGPMRRSHGAHELESLRMAFGDLPKLAAPDPGDERARGALLRQDRQPHGPHARGGREPAVPRPPPAARRLRRDRHRRALQSMRAAMEAVADGDGRARERRRLSSHLRHCKPCRRAAVAMGLDSLVLGARAGPWAPRSRALLPLPAFLRRGWRRRNGRARAAHAGAEHGATLARRRPRSWLPPPCAAGGAGVAHKAAGGGLPLVGRSTGTERRRQGAATARRRPRGGRRGARAARPSDRPGRRPLRAAAGTATSSPGRHPGPACGARPQRLARRPAAGRTAASGAVGGLGRLRRRHGRAPGRRRRAVRSRRQDDRQDGRAGAREAQEADQVRRRPSRMARRQAPPALEGTKVKAPESSQKVTDRAGQAVADPRAGATCPPTPSCRPGRRGSQLPTFLPYARPRAPRATQ